MTVWAHYFITILITVLRLIYVSKIFNPDKNTVIVHLFKVLLVGVRYHFHLSALLTQLSVVLRRYFVSQSIDNKNPSAVLLCVVKSVLEESLLSMKVPSPESELSV